LSLTKEVKICQEEMEPVLKDWDQELAEGKEETRSA
jgi:hypothetical protein